MSDSCWTSAWSRSELWSTVYKDLDVAPLVFIVETDAEAAPGVLAFGEPRSIDKIMQLGPIPAVEIVACHNHWDISPAGRLHNTFQPRVVAIQMLRINVLFDPAPIDPHQVVLAPLDGVEDCIGFAFYRGPWLDESGQHSQLGPNSNEQRVRREDSDLPTRFDAEVVSRGH